MKKEILKDLIHLFAIVGKQDTGPSEAKKDYVDVYLSQEIDKIRSVEIFNYFENFLKHEYNFKPLKIQKYSSEKLTSMIDSVTVLSLGKKINTVLSEEQKTIFIARLFEFCKTDNDFSIHRVEIIDTLAQIFGIDQETFNALKLFVKNYNGNEFENNYSKNITSLIAKESITGLLSQVN